jgi:hypothetical protein
LERGETPLPKTLPLSFKGEGDTEGEVVRTGGIVRIIK